MTFKTEQEMFWAGDFGKEYIGRNDTAEARASNVAMFARALRSAGPIGSCLEFGANIGLNLRALKVLFPQLDVSAIEINPEAADVLAGQIGAASVSRGSILDYEPKRLVELSLIKGVLIHIHPEQLPGVYRKLFEATSRWVLLCEYYNPTPVTIPYRGHSDRLFKRDFAGEMLDMFPALRLVDYGFCYRRDPMFPQDDVTWFLMEKRG